MDAQPSQYPIQFSVDYPEKPLSRLTTFFRGILIIPIAIIMTMVSEGSTFHYAWIDSASNAAKSTSFTVGFLFLAILLMILFRKKYPRWWFNWNLELARFQARVTSYFFLLRDEYPSTDEQQSVHLDFEYPTSDKLNRFLPLVKWLLAIPHYIVLIVLSLIAIIFLLIAWFAILFTAKYPRFLFNYIVAYIRWTYRVAAYAILLVTDKYPPFSFNP